jgi:plasmid maintenance system antidote protein VapI
MRGATRRNYTVRLREIGDALIAAGHETLDDQAKALGVKRSTAWNIVNGKNKLDRLSEKTTKRILANPNTPPSVRAIIRQYLAERS